MTEEEILTIVRKEVHDIIEEAIRSEEQRNMLGPSSLRVKEPDPLQQVLDAVRKRMS